MEVIIDPNPTAKQRIQYAWSCIKKMLEGGRVVLTIERESKSREQERKYHALINDIAKTVSTDKVYSFESWKALLVDEFQQDLKKSHGLELRHPGKFEISFDGQRVVSIRPSTKKFLKQEGSLFIEFLYAWGAEHGARFSEKSISYYDEIARAAA